MKRTSIKKVAKASMKMTGKAVRVGVKQAATLGKTAMKIEVPSSLNWIFGFGFKVGIFLMLKSFLIFRYQAFNLQMAGHWMIASQVIQALVLIACGALMQNDSLYDEPLKLRKIARYYGYAFLVGCVTFALREGFDWQFFREAASKNWFVDFFSSISKELGEIGLSVLFCDADLWAAFCGLLYFITNTYLHVSFDYEDGLWARIFDKVHFLREAYHVSEIEDDVLLEDISTEQDDE